MLYLVTLLTFANLFPALYIHYTLPRWKKAWYLYHYTTLLLECMKFILVFFLNSVKMDIIMKAIIGTNICYASTTSQIQCVLINIFQ